MQPYDYRIQQPNYAGSVSSGYGLGDKIKTARDRDYQNNIALKKQAEIEAQLIELSRDPSLEKIQSAVIRNPSLSDKFKPIIERMGEDEKKSQAGHAYKVLSALENKRPELAKKLFEDRAIAFSNSGKTKEAAGMKSMSAMVDKYPDLVKAESVFLINSLQGMDKLSENLDKFKKIDPSVRGIEASTDETIAKTEGTKQDTAKKEIMLPLETENLISEIDGQILANKSAKKKLEQMSDESGAIPVEDRAKAEDSLRAEYDKKMTFAKKRRASFEDIKSSLGGGGASDLALIFNYMKVLDPGVSVMEGDVRNVSNASGMMDSLITAYKDVFNSDGDKFRDKAERNKFLIQAQKLSKKADEEAAIDIKKLKHIATVRKLNHSTIFDPDRPSAEIDENVDKLPVFNGLNVTMPSGKVFIAKDQAQLDAFKARTGLK